MLSNKVKESFIVNYINKMCRITHRIDFLLHRKLQFVVVLRKSSMMIMNERCSSYTNVNNITLIIQNKHRCRMR